MNFKKIDQLKTPSDWMDSVLNTEQEKISHRKNNHKNVLKIAVAILVVLLCCGTGVAYAASENSSFKAFLQQIFGKENVTEVQGTIHKTFSKADILIGKNGKLELQENFLVTGENVSFVSEYHFIDDEEVVDQVYVCVDNGLKKVSGKTFHGDYDGHSFQFDYVIEAEEIYGYNLRGDISEVFFKVNKNEILVALWHAGRGNTVEKECIARVNLNTGNVEKLSNDNMICNFVMSPEGSIILCNHRADGYWSAFDVATKKEKKISTKLIDGYVRTSEIEFQDETHILTLGDTFLKNNVEYYRTNLVNLKTGSVDKTYNEYGDIAMKWSYSVDRTSLTIRNILNGEQLVINDVSESIHCLGNKGNYIIFGDLESSDGIFHIINMESKKSMQFHLSHKMLDGIELHLVEAQGKVLIANKKSAYLLDVSSLNNSFIAK